MKVNKDLMDALMMLSIIILVLTGTSDFENQTTKMILMVALGILAVVSIGFRFFGNTKETE